MSTVLLLVIGVAMLWAGYAAFTAWNVRSRGLGRLYWDEAEAWAAGVIAPPAEEGWLRRWLALAGFRHRGAPATFVMGSVATLVAGFAIGQAMKVTVLDSMVQVVSSIPGGVGEAFTAILQGGPWILLAVTALAPMLVVRAARRRRVREIEKDLPLALELLATMAEAGLSFDAALGRIVRSQQSDRPLIAELVNFQGDLLGGVPRLHALRQLARRVDVTSLTSFTSAIIQAEQVGASIAETLRHQADDLRERRREHALLLAQALPVKLVFPLVVCFLPGIFVSTLAPVIFQMIQVANGVLSSGGR